MMNMPMTIKTRSNCKESKPNANTRIWYRGSSTQLYVPAFPRRILTTFTITKINYNGVPNSYNFSSIQYLSNQKDHKLSLSNISSLTKVLREYWEGMKLLCKWRKMKSNQRVLSRNTSEMNEKYQHKNQEQISFEYSKLLNFSLENCCNESLPKHPYL